MRSIVYSIYCHSKETPDKVAIVATDYSLTYKELWAAISNVSLILKEHKINKGDRIMLEAGPTVEYLICCYGIHLIGAIHVPVEKDIPQSRIDEIAREISPRLIMNGKHPLEKIGISIKKLLDLDEASDYSFPSEDMLQEILFTTGTTGKSKGVMITHYAQMNMCEGQNAVLNYSVNNVWLIPTPMNHAAGLRKTHMSMVRGSSVVIMDGFKDLKLFFSNMRDYKVTSLYLPPSGVHYILMLAAKELAKFDEHLDFIYSSSAALPGGDKEKLIELLPHVRKFDAYGGSEVGAVCYIDYNCVRGKNRCVGKPNPGIEITIVDEKFNPISASEQNPGIIAIKSNTVTAGYWNEPELTKQTIHDGVIYMTDLGYLDKEGYLYIVGRRDDVINVGGLKVAPTEVEDVALRFDKILDCACIPYEDKIYGKCLKMFVTMKKDFVFDAGEITEYLSTKLEAYKLPKFLVQIDEIPKTYNGKTDRKRLIAMSAN